MSKRILVPVDGSSKSEKAFQHVFDELPDATVILVHVINPVDTLAFGYDEYFDAEAYQRLEQRERKEARDMLDEYRETATDRGMGAESVIRTGIPAKQILETASERDIDHIVMGSHGRTGVGRVLFGSVAETVTRRASVPVTIVR